MLVVVWKLKKAPQFIVTAFWVGNKNKLDINEGSRLHAKKFNWKVFLLLDFFFRELTSSKTLPQLAVIRRQSTPSGSMAWLMCFKASFQLRLQRRENAERLLVCFLSDDSSFLLCFKFSQSKLLHLTYFAKWDEGEGSCPAHSEIDLWRRSDGRITGLLSLFHSETIFFSTEWKLSVFLIYLATRIVQQPSPIGDWASMHATSLRRTAQRYPLSFMCSGVVQD